MKGLTPWLFRRPGERSSGCTEYGDGLHQMYTPASKGQVLRPGRPQRTAMMQSDSCLEVNESP
jgi:hypothetical protein